MSFLKIWKSYLFVLGCCFIGIFSVSLSNLFWGYYGIGFAICLILFTLFVLESLNNKSFEENKGVFYLILGGLFFQLLFFVVNDVFSVVVYQKSDVNFWGWIVIASQIYNCCAVAYLVLKMTFSIFKNKNVEIIEKSDFESKEKEANESDIEDLNIDNENVETIKVIPTINIKTKTFDEEEIK